MIVDSHCHLDFPELAADRADVIARAKANGVERMVTISTRVKRLKNTLRMGQETSSNLGQTYTTAGALEQALAQVTFKRFLVVVIFVYCCYTHMIFIFCCKVAAFKLQA